MDIGGFGLSLCGLCGNQSQTYSGWWGPLKNRPHAKNRASAYDDSAPQHTDAKQEVSQQQSVCQLFLTITAQHSR